MRCTRKISSRACIDRRNTTRCIPRSPLEGALNAYSNISRLLPQRSVQKHPMIHYENLIHLRRQYRRPRVELLLPTLCRRYPQRVGMGRTTAALGSGTKHETSMQGNSGKICEPWSIDASGVAQCTPRVHRRQQYTNTRTNPHTPRHYAPVKLRPVELNYLLAHVLQEVSVVRNADECQRSLGQELLQPLYRLHIQMIRRLSPIA